METISLEPFHVFQNDSINDIDDNSYRTMKIRTQVWMVEILKLPKFNYGKPISILKSDSGCSKSEINKNKGSSNKCIKSD